MKIKILHIINAGPILREFADTKIKIGVSYKIKKLIDECNIVMGSYDKRRTELLEKYAKLNKKGDKYEFPKGSKKPLALFNEGMKAMTEDEVEMDFPTLTLEELAPVEIEPSRIPTIEWFLNVA